MTKGSFIKRTYNIDLRQRSALSPLLFIVVMEIISRKINTKDILRKMMYADDLAIIAESKQDLQEVLEEWKGVFEKYGLRMSLEKTEVMWVGHQREELNIRLDGKEIKQVDGFVYLGGMVTEDGHSAAEVRRRTQAGANAWRKVEGVMLDRKKFKKLKLKVLRTCVAPVCMYGLETVALTEQQQQKLQECENNWVRRITRTIKEGGQKKDERPEERGWDAMQPNRKIGEKQDEMGWPLGKNGCRQTSKESRGGKTSRTQEKGKATCEMGGLRDSSLRQIGEDERCRDGAANINLWKERTERVARHYFT